MGNQQIHKRLVKEQGVAILENYLAKEIPAKEAIENLGVKRFTGTDLANSILNTPEADPLIKFQTKPRKLF